MSKNICLSKRDGLEMNGSSIGLGKKLALLQYAIIALKLPIRKRLL